MNQSDIAAKEITEGQKRRVAKNRNANAILTLLQTRYESTSPDLDHKMPHIFDDGPNFYNSTRHKWSRMRNYVYRSERLTLEQVEDVLLFLEAEFNNDAGVIGLLLQNTPRVLRKNVTTHLQPTVNFLRGLYGNELFLEAISRNPDLLVARGVGYDGGKNHGNDMESYLSDNLGLSKNAILNLKKKTPSIFQLSVTGKIQPVHSFLSSVFFNGGLQSSEVTRQAGRVITSCPHIFGLCVDTNLNLTVEFLRERCALDSRDVANVVKNSPGILGLSVKNNLLPTIDYLGNVLMGRSTKDKNTAYYAKADVSAEKTLLRKCITRHPQLLGLTLDNLREKVSFFDCIDQLSCCVLKEHVAHKTEVHAFVPIQDGLRPSNISLAARIALRAPSTYSLNLNKNILPKVDALARMWGCAMPEETLTMQKRIRCEGGSYLHLNKFFVQRDSISHRLGEYPAVLTLSLEGNIQPTLQFYNNTGYISINNEGAQIDIKTNGKEVKRCVTLRSRYIATSLYNRLLPRWFFVRDKLCDNAADVKVNGARSVPPLHLLAGATDAEFCSKLGFDLETFVLYKEEALPQLKFNYQFVTWLKTGRPIDNIM